MSSEISKLINVTFSDQTSYTPDEGEDVVATPIEHCWGEINKINVFNLKTFLAEYPEAHPIGAPSNVGIGYLEPWAQLRRALKGGASAVETFRVQGNWKYHQMNITEDATAPTSVVHVLSDSKFATTGCDISLALKYPGRPPCTGKYANFRTLRFDVTFYISRVLQPGQPPIPQIKVSVYGQSDEESMDLIEEHFGDFNAESVLDGQSYEITKVLARDSELVAISVLNRPTVLGLDQDFTYVLGTFTMPVAITSDVYFSAIQTSFSDSERSTATLLISPLNGDVFLNELLGSIATQRKDCNFIMGLPVASVMSEANLISYNTNFVPAAKYDMFTLFIAAREIFSVCGRVLYMDGTAGYAGAIARVAHNVKINQMPSARTYGSYDGTLVETLSFDSVLKLHNLGINSIYTSNVGATIFGIRSRHPRQTSYFAKANISRVTARLLRVIFPIILEVIHTETVSDPTNLAMLDSTLSRALGNFIAAGNIKPQSVVDLSNNDDVASNGGEILNINLEIFYKKLTEKVNIQIIATDSSITTNIS